MTRVGSPLSTKKLVGLTLFLGAVSLRIASSSSGSSPLIRPTRRPLTSHARRAAGGMICSSATRQTTSLIVGSPKGRDTIATFSRQRLGSTSCAAVPADASDHRSRAVPILVERTAPNDQQPSHRRCRQHGEPRGAFGSSRSWSGILSAIVESEIDGRV